MIFRFRQKLWTHLSRYAVLLNKVECRYNAVQHNIIFAYSTTMTEAKCASEVIFTLKTSHISHYGVSFVRIWVRINRVVTALLCIWCFHHRRFMNGILAAETMIPNVENHAQQHVLVPLMLFALLHPGFSLTVVQRYPYWSPYLPSTDSTELNYKLQAPIDVWPSNLFENFTKLKVMLV